MNKFYPVSDTSKSGDFHADHKQSLKVLSCDLIGLNISMNKNCPCNSMTLHCTHLVAATKIDF